MNKLPESRARNSSNSTNWTYRFSGPAPAFAAAILAVALLATYAFGHPFGIGAKATVVPAPTTAAEPTIGRAQTTVALQPTAVVTVPATPSLASAYPAVTPATSPAAPASLAVAPTATALQTTASCEIQPIRGFGLVYTSVPSLATRLGCATGQETGTSLTLQAYANGQTIDAPAQKTTFILTKSGSWSSHADGTNDASSALAALGAPSGSAQNVGGAIESFQHGTLLWTPDRVIFAMFADGGWEQHPDTFVDPTATPAPASQATAPSASPAPAPAVASCPAQPVRGFGLVYTGQANVATRLGCASDKEVGFSATLQSFEHGVMIQRLDTHQVFVVHADGSWSVYPDTFQTGKPLPSVGSPPANLVAPTGGIGLVWQQQAGVRQALGWATGPDQAVSGAWQGFAGGQMLWTSAGRIYVLYSDKTSANFPDKFVTPTSSIGSASG